MANLKRVPTWLLVEELITREAVTSCNFSSGPKGKTMTITVKSHENSINDRKEGNK